MKKVIVACAVVGVLAFANATQARHDDKPHGAGAVATEEKMMVEPKVHPGGRHDVQSHKNAIAAHNRSVAKKQAEAKAKAAAQAVQPPDVTAK